MRWQPIELPLQPGTIYTIIPAGTLKRLGIRPDVNCKCLLSDGRIVTREKGVAKFRYQRKTGIGSVIFALAGDPTAVGETTLASFGLDLDRKTGELKPLRMILA